MSTPSSNAPREKLDGQPWPPYRVRARNISRDADPSVHSDQVARSLGFKGALVAGRAIYSHLLHPLIERFGEQLLTRGRCEVRFLKPAYEGDPLTIHAKPAPGAEDERAMLVRAENGEGAEVALLEASLIDPSADSPPSPLPTPEAPSAAAAEPCEGGNPYGEKPGGDKAEGAWHLLEPGRPFATYPWRPTRAQNVEWCEEIGETLPLFREGETPPLHPGLVPTATTAILHEQLIIRGWIHVSSVFLTHGLLRAGRALELRATLMEKWEKNGRQFVKLHVAVMEGERLCVEEIRTALIKGE